MCKDTKRKEFYINRLVFQTFIGEIPKDKMVDHENQIKTDNNASNLRLLTRSENAKNCVPKKRKAHEIHQYTLNNKFVKQWESGEDIENDLEFDRAAIHSSAFGRSKSSNGFIWKYPEYVRVTDLSG